MINGKYTQKDLIKLGFTRKMIEKMLPEPEFVQNRVIPNTPDVKLWNQTDVENVLKTPRFKASQGDRQYKHDLAKEIVQIKSDNTKDIARCAIESLDVRRVENLAELTADLNLLEKVTYVRNHLSNFKELIKLFDGKVGASHQRANLFIVVNSQIGTLYPELGLSAQVQMNHYNDYLYPKKRFITHAIRRRRW